MAASSSPAGLARQVGGDGQVAGLAVAARQRPVGDLAHDRLDEPVLAALGLSRSAWTPERSPAHQAAGTASRSSTSGEAASRRG